VILLLNRLPVDDSVARPEYSFRVQLCLVLLILMMRLSRAAADRKALLSSIYPL
jgi:hypothetical protein